MRLLIAGGRQNRLKLGDVLRLDRLHREHHVALVLTGGCTGVDHDAEAWAKKNGIPVMSITADWMAFGRKAGPLRNQRLVDSADSLAYFDGGRGTADVLRRAQKKGLDIFNFGSKA